MGLGREILSAGRQAPNMFFSFPLDINKMEVPTCHVHGDGPVSSEYIRHPIGSAVAEGGDDIFVPSSDMCRVKD